MVSAHEPHPSIARLSPFPALMPLAAFLGVRTPIREELGEALVTAGFAVVDAGEPLIWPDAAALAVIEPECELMAGRLIGRLRGGVAGPLVLALAPYWCEFEPELRRLADAVLHTPLRREEYLPVASSLHRLAVRPRWVTAALAN